MLSFDRGRANRAGHRERVRLAPLLWGNRLWHPTPRHGPRRSRGSAPPITKAISIAGGGGQLLFAGRSERVTTLGHYLGSLPWAWGTVPRRRRSARWARHE